MMSGNTTQASANVTVSGDGSVAGLAVGLTFLFLSLGIAAGLVIYKYYNKIRSWMDVGPRPRQEKEECAEEESHRYSTMIREQPGRSAPSSAPGPAPGPVYENLTIQAAAPKTSAPRPHRSPDQPEEDWYLQSDAADDPIYNNYSAFKSNPPEQQDEDVYILPDSS